MALTEIAPLADEIQLNVAVAVWGNHGPTIVRIEGCSKPIHVNMRPGTVMTPLMASATGRLFAAFLPDRITRPIIEAELSRLVLTDQPAPRASRKLADEMLAEVRRHGLARALGNPIPGINAFSAPVFDSGGNIALCITAMGPAAPSKPNGTAPPPASCSAVRRRSRAGWDLRAPGLNHQRIHAGGTGSTSPGGNQGNTLLPLGLARTASTKPIRIIQAHFSASDKAWRSRPTSLRMSQTDRLARIRRLFAERRAVSRQALLGALEVSRHAQA